MAYSQNDYQNIEQEMTSSALPQDSKSSVSVPSSETYINFTKRQGNSTLFFAALICFSLTIVGHFLLAALNPNIVLPKPNVSGSNYSIFSILISAIFSILSAIGLWMFFIACKTQYSEINVSGIKLTKVVYIIQFLFSCMYAVGLLIAGILALLGNTYIYEYLNRLFSDIVTPLEISIISVIIILSSIIGFVVVALYYRGILRALSSLLYLSKGTAPKHNISMFMIVLNFLIAISNFISTFNRFSFSHGYVFYLYQIITLLHVVSIILFSCCALKCRKELRDIA